MTSICKSQVRVWVQWPETTGSEIQSYPQIQSLWYAWTRRKSVSNQKREKWKTQQKWRNILYEEQKVLRSNLIY